MSKVDDIHQKDIVKNIVYNAVISHTNTIAVSGF